MKTANLFKRYSILSAAGLVVVIVLFGNIGDFPIRLWDESRLAINAYEMQKDGDFIVTHYEGEPDMWNTKPPLMIWCQAFWMKTIGVNEWAVRLPSALAALLTVLLLCWFSWKYMKDIWAGIIASLILVTIQGYVAPHVVRTGDYDALLILFTTLYCLSLFAFLETNKNGYLYLFFVSLTLSVLTKGIAGVLFLPGLFLYILWQKKLLQLLKNKHTWFGMALFLCLAVGYYLLREYRNPGYLAAVLQNGWLGRYLEVSEQNAGGLFYYFRKLPVWVLAVPCSVVVVLIKKESKLTKLSLFLAVTSITYFVIISLSKTKLPWYLAPIYPLLALFVAITIYYLFDLLRSFAGEHTSRLMKTVPFLFLFVIFLTPVQKVLYKNYVDQWQWDGEEELYRMSRYLQYAVRSGKDLSGKYVVYSKMSGYYDAEFPHIQFYVNILNDRGTNLSYKDWKNLNTGDTIIVQQADIEQYIRRLYHYETVEQEGRNQIATLRILSIKSE